MLMALGCTIHYTEHNYSRFKAIFDHRLREAVDRTDPLVRDPERGVIRHDETPVGAPSSGRW